MEGDAERRPAAAKLLNIISMLRHPPEGTAGPYSVRRAPSLAPGASPLSAGGALPEKTVLAYHTGEKTTPLMSTSPHELALMLADAHEFTGGDALVAGLGLGVFPQLIESRAISITVVEIEPAVVELVWEHVRGPNWKLVVGDAYDFIATTERRFDFVYLDTWYGSSYSPDQLPLHLARKALSHRVLRPGGKVVIWDEQGMREQYAQDGVTIRELLLPLAQAGKFEQAARELASQRPDGRAFFEWLLERGGPDMVSAEEARQQMGRILDQRVQEAERHLGCS